MKKKILILMLCGLTICGGCGKSSDESDSVDVEISAGQSDSQSTTDESDNATSNENTSDDDTSSSDVSSSDSGQKSELATSLAEDADVRKAQEEYMKNIHSVKGKSVIARSENEILVTYEEWVPAEEEGNADKYSYKFFFTKTWYDMQLKEIEEHGDVLIIENDEEALYIKTKSNKKSLYSFDDREQKILGGDETFGVYVE